MGVTDTGQAARHEALAEGLFFIVGTGRCGSTLLQAMLSSHRRIMVTPETKFFAFLDPLRFVGDPIPSDEALDEYLTECAGSWFWKDLDLDVDRLRDDAIAGGRSARCLFLAILAQCHARDPKPRLGEKTPGHFKEIPRLAELFPDAKFIHIYRDPRDVVASMLRYGWSSHQSAMLHARTWAKTMRRDEQYARTLGSSYTRLRFEDLVDDPEQQLRRLCEFLGEEYDEAMLRFDERADAGFGESEMAWKGQTLQPLTKATRGRYRAELSPHQIATIERTAGVWLSRRGYEADPDVSQRLPWTIADAIESTRWWATRQARSISKRLSNPGPYEAMRSSAIPRIRRV